MPDGTPLSVTGKPVKPVNIWGSMEARCTTFDTEAVQHAEMKGAFIQH